MSARHLFDAMGELSVQYTPSYGNTKYDNSEVCYIMTENEKKLNECKSELTCYINQNIYLENKLVKGDEKISASRNMCSVSQISVESLTREIMEKDERFSREENEILKEMEDLANKMKAYEEIIMKLDTDVSLDLVRELKVLPLDVLTIFLREQKKKIERMLK